MASADEQVRRMMAMIPYLYAHERTAVSELAEMFSVSEKTILKDLNNIWLSGSSYELQNMVVVTFDDQDAYVSLSNADYFSHPQRFRFSEATTLLAGLQALRATLDSDGVEACDSASAKLKSALLEGERTAKVEIQFATGEIEIRQALLDALQSGHQVLLTYHGQSRGEITTPTVDPARIITQEGFAYLQGWSSAASAWRLYRLDRIEEVDILDSVSMDQGTPPDLSEGWLVHAPRKQDVVMELLPGASWVTWVHPVKDVEHLSGGKLRVTLEVVNETWFAQLLLSLGADVISVDPPSARDAALHQARRAVEFYESSNQKS